jgi:hypothetical protein
MNKKINIAFLFALAKNELWSTPLSIVNEAKRRGIEFRVYSLYDEYNRYTDRGLLKLIEDVEDGYNPDILLHMDYGAFNHPLLDKKFFKNIFTVLEAGDDPQCFYNNFPKAPKFDLILTPDLPSVESYKKHGLNAIYWTHFADVIAGTESSYIIPNYDLVCTRGDGTTPFLDQIKFKLGNRFNNFRDFNIYQRDILSSGKIVIQKSTHGEVTRRIFEGMMCKRMVITDRLSEERGLHLLFEENKDIVFYDSLDEAIEKINYYSTHEEERLKIALSGHLKTASSHTTVQRLDTILEHFLKR